MKKITLELNKQSIQNAIDEIEKYIEQVRRNTQRLAQRLAEYGVDVARLTILQYDAVESYELFNSMEARQASVFTNGAKFLIYTGCSYAPFVEFGTGWVGANSQGMLPDVPNDWQYDSHNHGIEGWYFIGKDGVLHHTNGMQGRPFMWQTYTTLLREFTDIAREVFQYGN